MTHLKTSAILTSFIILVIAAFAVADVPRVMNYQGQMTGSSGSPLDTTIQMVFTIYDDSTGNNIIWTETQGSVEVIDGQFSVMLGSVSSLNDDVFSAVDRFLGITIGSDAEIDPRTRLGAVPYSIRSSTIDGALGGTIEGPVEINTAGGKAIGLTVNGTIESTSGGFKFPDGTEQVTAATGNPSGGGWVDDGNYIRLENVNDSIGIGTATPSEKLEIIGNIVVSGKATIGQDNFSNPGYTFVAGVYDTAYGFCNVISGGLDNKTNGQSSTVGGGTLNEATGSYSSTVAGGERNMASATYSAVGGGVNNTAGGFGSTVPGGEYNEATGDHSFAAGYRAKAHNNGTFVWADESGTFTSTADNQFLIQASGGVGIGTAGPTEALEVAGTVYSTSGGFKFPDGTTQTTAATGGGGWIDDGTNVRLETITDKVLIGITTPSSYPLTVGDGIIVTNDAGDMKSRMHSQSDVGWMMTYGPNGNTNTRISCTWNGAENFGSYWACNSDGDARAEFYVDPDDYGAIYLRAGPSGIGNVYAGGDASFPAHGSIDVRDASGAVLAKMYVNADGNGHIYGDLLEATSLGVKFPDGTTQTTAATAPVSSGWVDDGTTVRLQTSTDRVAIGTETPSSYQELTVQTGIQVNNSTGDSRIVLDAGSDHGNINLYGDNGTSNARLGNHSDPDHGGLTISNNAGHVRATMGSQPATNSGEIELYGSTGLNIYMGVSNSAGTRGSMEIYDENGDEQINMYVNSSGDGTILCDYLGAFDAVWTGNSVTVGNAGSSPGYSLNLADGIGMAFPTLEIADNAVEIDRYSYGGYNQSGAITLRGRSGISTYSDNVYIGSIQSEYGVVEVEDNTGSPQAQMYADPVGGGVVWWSKSGSLRIPNPDKRGTDIVYSCIEGPESAAYFRGTAELINGEAVISVPDHFRHVAGLQGMTVQLTPLSAQSKGLAVIEKGLDRIMVQELMDGKGNYQFDYTVMSIKSGRENYEVVRPHSEVELAMPIGDSGPSGN